MSLIDLIAPRKPKLSDEQKLELLKAQNESGIAFHCNTPHFESTSPRILPPDFPQTPKIPEYEKIPDLIVPDVPVSKVIKLEDSEDFHIFFLCLKNPRYVFRYCTRSFANVRQYWFLDKKKGISIILLKDEIDNVLTKG